jgi:predicted transcriptional regulator
MALAKQKSKRNPDRKKSTANVSLPWDVYDRLDKLAESEKTSLGRIVEGLIDYYEEREGKQRGGFDEAL